MANDNVGSDNSIRADYQVLYATIGRIRLSVPAIRSRPELASLLVACLVQQPGIAEIRIFPASGAIVINYDPRLWSLRSVLQALHEQSGRTRRTRPSMPTVLPALPTLPPGDQFPFTACSVLHATVGRVRLGIPAVKADAKLAAALESYLRRQPGVTQVRLSRAAESVVVEFQPGAWDGNALVMLVRGFDPARTPPETTAPQAIDAPADTHSPARAKLELALASSALAVSLVAGPTVTPLIYGMLWISSMSIYQRAYKSLLGRRKLNVDVLDATALTLLTAQGIYWQAALLNALLSGAELIRGATQERARRELSEVLETMSGQAWVVRDGTVVAVAAEEVEQSDTVAVFPGERIPVDGIVLSGRALVDQHTLTGESMPVEKTQDGEVFAMTVVTEGELRLCATRVGSQTHSAQIARLIMAAPIFDTRAQDYAERWANRLVPFSFLGAGVLAALGRLEQAVTLLIIDYSAGFKVAAPTAVMSALTHAARRGIFIRGGRHLEQLARVDALVIDKTGTLTAGCPDVVEVISLDRRYDRHAIITLAAAAEQHLSHPVAQAVTNYAARQGYAIPVRGEADYAIGQGVAAQVGGVTVHVGNRRFLAGAQIGCSARAERALRRLEGRAISPLLVAVDGVLVGILGLADPIRPEAGRVIGELAELGIQEICMLTGDRAAVADTVARALGISSYAAEVFPHDKLAAVQRLQAQGYTVAVIGDGINDSPALAQADVGIAVCGGTALAQETADVVILHGDLAKLTEAIRIARQGVGVVRQSWNMVKIPNSIGLGLACAGAIGPVTASLISDGAALAAGVNSLRLLAGGSTPPHPNGSQSSHDQNSQ